jgi:hypothetical protein
MICLSEQTSVIVPRFKHFFEVCFLFSIILVMIWCFYYLAVHPEIQEKVYQELIEVLGDEDIKPLVASKLQ